MALPTIDSRIKKVLKWILWIGIIISVISIPLGRCGGEPADRRDKITSTQKIEIGIHDFYLTDTWSEWKSVDIKNAWIARVNNGWAEIEFFTGKKKRIFSNKNDSEMIILDPKQSHVFKIRGKGTFSIRVY